MTITELSTNTVSLDSWGNPSASPARLLYLKTQPTMFTVGELEVKYSPGDSWPAVYALDTHNVVFVLELYKTLTTVGTKNYGTYYVNAAHTRQHNIGFLQLVKRMQDIWSCKLYATNFAAVSA